MMSEKNLSDYHWLISSAAEPLLAQTAEAFLDNRNALAIAKALRKQVSSTRSALVMEQAQLRLKARVKFQNADNLFFTRKGYEQSSGETVARYKASRFRQDDPILDVCCGIGGDLMEFARQRTRGSGVCGLDSSELESLLARKNLEVLGLDLAEVQSTRFEDHAFAPDCQIHVDPDRRVSRRTVRGELMEPSLPMLLERLADSEKGFAIKVAPATPFHECLPADVHLEWIGSRRECKQQVIWQGDLAELPGQKTATMVEPDGSVHQFSAPRENEDFRVPKSTQIGRFLFEPHPSVRAAGLADRLAASCENFFRISSRVDFMTAQHRPRPVQRLFTTYKVLSAHPMDLKIVHKELRRLNVGRIEVKKLGVELQAQRRFEALPISGEQTAVVILTRKRHQRIAIIAKRIANR